MIIQTKKDPRARYYICLILIVYFTGCAGIFTINRKDPMPEIITAFGYDWELKHHDNPEEKFGPGPNLWNAANVERNGDGLVLHIRKESQGWTCAELKTEERLGFGTYTWQVDGPLDKLDKQIILGLFNYPPPEVGPDGTNEVDIEIAEFDHLADYKLVFGYFPSSTSFERQEKAFNFELEGTYTTLQFTWTAGRVAFRAWHGHTPYHEERVFAEWEHVPNDASIPRKPMPIHINLWLYKGQPPTDGEEVSIGIKSFTYEPAQFATLYELERNHIIDVLAFTSGRVSGSTLYDRIEKLRIKEKVI